MTSKLHKLTITVPDNHQDCFNAFTKRNELLAQHPERPMPAEIVQQLKELEIYCGSWGFLGCLEYNMTCPGDCGFLAYFECDHNTPDLRDELGEFGECAFIDTKQYHVCSPKDDDICAHCKAYYEYEDWFEQDHLSNYGNGWESSGECFALVADTPYAEAWEGPHVPGEYDIEVDTDGYLEDSTLVLRPTSDTPKMLDLTAV